MSSPPFRVRATDLYDLAVCPHRVVLDRRLPREARSEPDEAARLLARAGLEHEARVAAGLGYPRPEHEPGDFAAGAAHTAALLREGVPGLYQGVLLEERYLAIPDLLERRDGASELGDFHYVPGDVKAGLTPRADQVLQVSFAGWLLGRLQGRVPEEGFLVLGDGSRERFSLRDVSRIAEAALRQVEAILDGGESTGPFYDSACRRCRWAVTCLPEMLERGDLSLVDGMTHTRRRVLQAAGITTLPQLAGIDPRAWRREGRPALGLEALVRQARALLSGQPEIHRGFALPEPREGDLLVHPERDPLDAERVVVLGWTAAATPAAPGPPRRVRVTLDPVDRRAAAAELFGRAEAARGTLYVYGAQAAAALLDLAEEIDLPPARQVALEHRLVNLAAVLRRTAAYLPVRRYELDEVTEVLAGRPLPAPQDGPAPAFVLTAGLRRGLDGPWPELLEALGEDRLDRLDQLTNWLRRHPAPATAPRR
jgi:predicted RecB family nuclease